MSKSKRIAIIGAGLAGLGLAYHLLSGSSKFIELTLFDPEGICGGASKAAAGLLHPLGGEKASLSPFGLEGLQMSRALIYEACQELDSSCILHEGIFRIASTETQAYYFKKSFEKHKNDLSLEWLEAGETQNKVPGAPPSPALHIKQGLALDVKGYLLGLSQILKKKKANFQKTKVESLRELSDFDLIVITAGNGSLIFNELSHLPLRPLKGQGLIFDWPENLPHLEKALNSKCYLVMQTGLKSCYVGATFERNATDFAPDYETAYAHLMPALSELFPPLANASPLKVECGIRLSTPNHMPIATQISEKVFALLGLGSKGLLYHSIYGKKLANEILLYYTDF